MAAVKIIRPPLCADPAVDVPEHLWPQLIEERRRFCREVMPYDCRLLLFFIEDGAGSNWIGYGTRKRYLSEGLGLDPEVVELALRGLMVMVPDQELGLDQAVILGKHGGDRKSAGRNQVTNDHLTANKLGPNTVVRTLARLDRDHPDLAERVRAGEMSANAAAIRAGFRNKPSLLDQIRQLISKLTDDERMILANELPQLLTHSRT
jgi:hypothetical protein